MRFLPEPGRYADGRTGGGSCGELVEPWLVGDDTEFQVQNWMLTPGCSTVCGSDPTDGSSDANGELTVNWVSKP